MFPPDISGQGKVHEICKLILTKIIEIAATRCHTFKLNTPNSILTGALPQTPLGELTALP